MSQMSQSLMNDLRLIQGDSSDIFTFGSASFSSFASPDWESEMSIRRESIQGEEVIKRSLLKSDDNSKFIFQILPTESEGLEPGTYFLTIEIRNIPLGFRREIVQTKIKIVTQGLS